MGCDIHSHIEVKINDVWHHYQAPCIPRNYTLFGKLAGVRKPEEALFGEPRGIPHDCSEVTLLDYEITFGHTASWITWQELKVIMDYMNEDYPQGHQSHAVMGYLFQNAYSPRDGVTDVRMVFWFDN